MDLIRFDGIYCCIHYGSNDMLRFYDDGTVIKTQIIRSSNDLGRGNEHLFPVGDWFDRDNKERSFSRGTYKAEGDHENAAISMEIRTQSQDYNYNGTIEFDMFGRTSLHLSYRSKYTKAYFEEEYAPYDEENDYEDYEEYLADEDNTFIGNGEYVFYSDETIAKFHTQNDAVPESESEPYIVNGDDIYTDFI